MIVKSMKSKHIFLFFIRRLLESFFYAIKLINIIKRKELSMRLFRLLKYLTKNTDIFIFTILNLIAYSAFILTLPWFLKIIINTVFESRDKSELNMYCWIFVAALPFLGLVIYFQGYLNARLNHSMIRDLRTDVFFQLLDLPISFFTQHRQGAIFSRVTNDITFIQMTLMMSTFELLRQLILLIGGICLMLLLNWQLALIVFLSSPIFIGLSCIFGKKTCEQSTILQDISADLGTEIEETLAGIKEIKSYTQEDYEQKRFKETIGQRFSAKMKLSKIQALLDACITPIGMGLIISMVWFGGFEAISGDLQPGNLLAIMLYMWIIIGPVKGTARTYSNLQQSIGASIRIFEILDNDKEKDEGDAIGINDFTPTVIFQNVSFKYPERENLTLKDISFQAKKGMKIAIVGRNGAGKTTLVNLIPRFFEPENGSILISGEPLNTIKRSFIRQQIGLVPQETFLFGGTIGENIAYSTPAISQESIVEAAKLACAHDFIMATPNQYNTVIGDRGVKLSAGQRQRIAIARLILKKCSIVILDEATTSLDVESVRDLNIGIRNLAKDKTTFIVTHNLSSIKKADLILVLDEGKIVEKGTYQELMKKDGLYKELYSIDG